MIKVPKHKAFSTISIMTTSFGTYAMPGWIPVLPGTTIADCEWSDEYQNTNAINIHKPEIVKIMSTNGQNHYMVTLSPLGNSCTCVGYSYRKQCKHIDAALTMKANIQK